MLFSRQRLYALAIFTLLVFTAIGWAIVHFGQNRSLTELLMGNMCVEQQLCYGIGYGTGFALFMASLLSFRFFSPVRAYFSLLFAQDTIRWYDIIIIAASAGIGEEILFRGGIQPYLGVWLTSVLFIFVHGYLSLSRLSWFAMGLVLVVMSAGLGYFAHYLGLASAIAAHMVYDWLIINLLVWQYRNSRYAT